MARQRLLGLFLVFCHYSHANSETGVMAPPTITHGVAVGDVRHNRAIVWSRSDSEAKMIAELFAKGMMSQRTNQTAHATDDFTAQLVFENLLPDRQYTYRVWFENAHGSSEIHTGAFRTPPKPDTAGAVKLVWAGDFAGQNVCRDRHEGFPILTPMFEEKPDVFIGLGDMIYADNLCEPVGRYGNKQIPKRATEAVDLPGFWAHWRYTRADPGLQKLLASSAYYGIWDDHEVINDFGPHHATGSVPPYDPRVSLLPAGLKAFFDYTPIDPEYRDRSQMYRAIRWGEHLAIFFLDNRQYRDANLLPDSETKSMLGAAQLAWLKKQLRQSDATWQLIVSSVPLSIPTGFPAEKGRDGWANHDDNNAPTVSGIPQSSTGFERELHEIIELLQEEQKQVLFITTDVHFAQVFRYTPSQNVQFQFYEAVVGPGNAGIFPNRHYDRSLGAESLFFYGPSQAADVLTWREAKKWFNYGVLDISHGGKLQLEIKNAYGKTVFNLDLSR